MTRYLYRGPMSGATLRGGREVLLHDGKPVDLPADNSWVRDLVVRGHLVEIKAIPPSEPAPPVLIPPPASTAMPPQLDLASDPDSLSTTISKKKGGN